MLQIRGEGILSSVTYTLFGTQNGEYQKGQVVVSSSLPGSVIRQWNRKLGYKNYELSNHLGNVLVTISDRKLAVQGNPLTTVSKYLADVVATNDYSAFGAPMVGRGFNSPSYRYGFNGVERNDEEGTGMYSTEYREYDSRIGRWTSIDLVVKPWESPYAGFANNPIYFVDPSGLDPGKGDEGPGFWRRLWGAFTGTQHELRAETYANELRKIALPKGLSATINTIALDEFTTVVVYKIMRFETTTEVQPDGTWLVVGQDVLITEEYSIFRKHRKGGSSLGNFTEYGQQNDDIGLSRQEYLEAEFSNTVINVDLPASGVASSGVVLLGSGKKYSTILRIASVAPKTVNATKTISSLVKQDSKLLKLAKETFEGNDLLRKEAKGLLEQLNLGNMNPGIGTKNIGKNIFEARSKGGARVYFRNGINGVEILGYSNKANQQQVIHRVLEIY
jgi:RHS repeat-associated protein